MAGIEGRWTVDTGWLAARLDDPRLAVLDGSWHLPNLDRDARADYAERRIPGAVFFDIDAVADRTSPLPHMLPSAADFAAQVGAMGVGDDSAVVVYDSAGLFSAARVWWTFRAFGFDRVAVLDGGLPKWESEGRPLESGPARPRPPARFTARLDPALVRDRAAVLEIVRGGGAQVVDARSAARFAGTAPEPRPGLRAGHIPGSRNLPYTVLLNKDGTLKTPEQIAAILEGAEVDPAAPVVASCGSGVTASIVALALATIGRPRAAVYDGSWSEWGADASLPIETGAAE